MKSVEKADCPLCDLLAEFRWADHGNRKTFDCETCMQFQISRRAEDIVHGLPKEDRLELSKLAASADEDSMLLIRIPNLHLSKHPKQPFTATIELRSELAGLICGRREYNTNYFGCDDDYFGFRDRYGGP